MTSRDGEMILVYPLPVYEEHEIRLASLPSADPAVENYVRTLNYWGRETPIDGQGRILISPMLRESAAIDGEVSVFGKQRTLEICNHERFRRRRPSVTAEELARLAQYGL